MISIQQPAGKTKSHLDGAIAISDIYGPVPRAMETVAHESYRKSLENICILGIGWAMAGGMCRTLRLRNSLAVSGLAEIIKVFDDIERGKLTDIDYIEAYSCLQGCVGGSLTVENVYVSYNKILKLIETLEFEKIKACPDIREVRRLCQDGYFSLESEIRAPPDQAAGREPDPRRSPNGRKRTPFSSRFRRSTAAFAARRPASPSPKTSSGGSRGARIAS